MADNVITFKKRDDADPLVKRKPINYGGCRHKYTIIDEALRTVECEDCQVLLDPIEVLLDLCTAYTERDYKFQLISEYEAKERAKAEKRRARRA